MKKVFLAAIICSFVLGNFSAISQASPPEESPAKEVEDSLLDDVNWYWLNSDAKYSKYFDPESLQINSRIITDTGSVPTEIQGWTKTTYSFEGAVETIQNYGIEKLIPDPTQLSYSLALLKIDPQNRTIQYAREDFYNPEGKIIWSKNDGRVKEINSQSFDEDFYAAIIDEVFRQGETNRRTAEDRWIDLWTVNDENGTTTVAADTTTFRFRNNNLIFWEWIETKNSEDKTIEIFFLKKMINLPQGTEKTASGEKWTPHNGWTKYNDEMNGGYRMIQSDEPAYKGLIRLRAYAKQNPDWINRYSVD
ncbi:MAG: hypothetical protein IJ575_09255 [Selenomonadaceae bacterium]|nr:hypothetical protein [Selenomonadaceae bacterium]